jgi:hypothetical protein
LFCCSDVIDLTASQIDDDVVFVSETTGIQRLDNQYQRSHFVRFDFDFLSYFESEDCCTIPPVSPDAAGRADKVLLLHPTASAAAIGVLGQPSASSAAGRATAVSLMQPSASAAGRATSTSWLQPSASAAAGRATAISWLQPTASAAADVTGESLMQLTASAAAVGVLGQPSASASAEVIGFSASLSSKAHKPASDVYVPLLSAVELVKRFFALLSMQAQWNLLWPCTPVILHSVSALLWSLAVMIRNSL